MYQSIPSVTTPLANFQKSSNPCWAIFLCQIPGGRASLGPLILIHFTLFFTVFKISIFNLPTEYLQIRRENIDLSMKHV